MSGIWIIESDHTNIVCLDSDIAPSIVTLIRHCIKEM